MFGYPFVEPFGGITSQLSKVFAIYARRAVAGMQFQYGLSEFVVSPKDLGRFHYPTGPKPPAAPMQKSAIGVPTVA